MPEALPTDSEEHGLRPLQDVLVQKAADLCYFLPDCAGLHKQLDLTGVRLALDTEADKWVRGLHCNLISRQLLASAQRLSHAPG